MKNTYTGLSLRAGGQGFSLDTKNVSPGYSYRKQKKNRTKRISLLYNSPPTNCRYPANWNFSHNRADTCMQMLLRLMLIAHYWGCSNYLNDMCYWHVCYKIIGSGWMGGIKRKSTGSPAFFPQGHAQLSLLDHFFSALLHLESLFAGYWQVWTFELKLAQHIMPSIQLSCFYFEKKLIR